MQLAGTCGGGRCAENAECLFDDVYQTHYCTCKSGYEGDGITECKPAPLGCNVLNNCGLHAECIYDQLEDAYKCLCKEGKLSSKELSGHSYIFFSKNVQAPGRIS